MTLGDVSADAGFILLPFTVFPTRDGEGQLMLNQYSVAFGNRMATCLTADEALWVCACLLTNRPCGWLRTPEEQAEIDRRNRNEELPI